MPNSLARLDSVLSYSFYGACALGFVALFFAPFLVSIATAIILLVSIPRFLDVLKQHPFLIASLIVMLVLASLDMLRTTDMGESLHQWSFVLTLLLFTTAALYYMPRNSKLNEMLFAWLSVVVILVNLHALYFYLLDKENIDLTLQQGWSIPLINHFHHIHFGIINGIVLMILSWLIFIRKTHHKWFHFAAFAIIVVSFHMLSSRTGLLAVYVSAGVVVVFESIKRKQYKWIFIATALGAVALIGAFSFSSSFKAKVVNSLEDYQSWGNGADINYKSMGMRLEANKMAKGVIMKNMLTGVGSHGIDSAIAQEYEVQETMLISDNRILPHNQFMIYALKYGIPGLLFFVALIVVLCYKSFTNEPIFMLVLLLLLFSLFFEALFERQAGIFFSVLLLGLSAFITKE